VNVDWSDVGNILLTVSGVATAYAATIGDIGWAAIIAGVGGVLKAVASAVDNYQYKKSQAALAQTPAQPSK
jgi:hypothetical protein